MTTWTWVGGGINNAYDPTLWSPAGLAIGDTLSILSGTMNIAGGTLDDDPLTIKSGGVATINLSAGANLTLAPTGPITTKLTVTGGLTTTLTFAGNETYKASQLVLNAMVTGVADLTFTEASSVEFDQGVSAGIAVDMHSSGEGVQLVSPGNFSGQLNLTNAYLGFMNVYADSYTFDDGLFSLYVGQTPVDTVRLNTQNLPITLEENGRGVFVSTGTADQTQPGGTGFALPVHSFETPPPSHFTVDGEPVPGEAYTGPVAWLDWDFIQITPANLNITSSSPNTFIHSGNGDDGIDASGGGTNVIDGGGGSNFLTGGTGKDTFFVDDRQPSVNIWTTVQGFHKGDIATIWGITPTNQITTVDNAGAAGHTGLTFGVTTPGKPDANLTLTGLASADLSKLSISFGHTADLPGLRGSDYMMIRAL